MTEELREHNLTLGQFAIMMTLLEGDGISQKEIGEKVRMPGYGTTRNIDVLEAAGFLTREKQAKTRRSFAIRLTEKGCGLGPALFEIVQRVNREFIAPLSQGEERQLRKILSKLLKAEQERRQGTG